MVVRRKPSGRKLTEADIQRALFKHLDPNGTFMAPGMGTGREIADFLTMKEQSGRVHEFEIKVDLYDFREDFKKGKHKIFPTLNALVEMRSSTKFPGSRLTKGGGKGAKREYTRDLGEYPNYFSYVVPDYLWPDVKDEIPEYAGAIVVNSGSKLLNIGVTKSAPVLHKNVKPEYWMRKFIFSLSTKVKTRMEQDFQERWK